LGATHKQNASYWITEGNKNLQTKRQKESRETIKGTSGFVLRELDSKWPNCMLAAADDDDKIFS